MKKITKIAEIIGKVLLIGMIGVIFTGASFEFINAFAGILVGIVVSYILVMIIYVEMFDYCILNNDENC